MSLSVNILILITGNYTACRIRLIRHIYLYRGGPRGYWIVDLGLFKAWILDFEEKNDWILDFQKSVGFGFLINFILDSGYWKKYHWILDFWTKIRWILDLVRFVGFSLDLDFSKNYSWILDFGQKKAWIIGFKDPPQPPPLLVAPCKGLER